nr:replication-relaxation family protein [Streptomyces sp. NBC_00899]
MGPDEGRPGLRRHQAEARARRDGRPCPRRRHGGAPHAMAVNATVVAFTRGGRLPGSPAGIGGIDSWRSEVPHPLSSSGKGNVRADAVFQDKDAGVPLLMVEVDRYTESAHILADKVASYADLYARQSRDPALPASTGRSTIGERSTVAVLGTLYPCNSLPRWAAVGDRAPRAAPPRFPTGFALPFDSPRGDTERSTVWAERLSGVAGAAQRSAWDARNSAIRKA